MIHWGWIVFGVLFFIFMVTAIMITAIILWRLRWNMTWVVLQEQPNGKCEIVRKGRMRVMAFGDGGEEIYFLRGINKWKVAYGKRIGKNQVAWAIGQDGYWYNCDFAGLDKKLRELGVFPVDRDMRYANSTVRKGIEIRHGQQKTFMEAYGTIIAFGMLFMCIIGFGGSVWFAFHELNKGKTDTKDILKIQEDIAKRYETLYQTINNQQNAGSGIRTVTPA